MLRSTGRFEQKRFASTRNGSCRAYKVHQLRLLLLFAKIADRLETYSEGRLWKECAVEVDKDGLLDS